MEKGKSCLQLKINFIYHVGYIRPANIRNIHLWSNGYQVVPGGKVRPGRDADPSPPSSAEVKNRVELHLYSP